MSTPFRNLLALPKGMLLFLVIYAFSFPVLLIEHLAFGTDIIEYWVALSPAMVWKGEVWRLVTYFPLVGAVLPWAVNLFWFATLISVLSRNWSSLKFWIFCSFTALAGAVPIVLLLPRANFPMLSAGAVVFGLLAAWVRLYGRERLIMLGLGEMSVRQAGLFIAAINLVISFFACGRPSWTSALFTASLVLGGLAGWAYLAIGDKRVMSRPSHIAESARIARLEL